MRQSKQLKKNQVAKAIRKVLEKREPVSLTGVGTIMLDNLSAKIIKKGKAITPPRAILTIYDTHTSNGPLKKHLTKKLGLSKKQAEKAINSFSERIVNKLLNYGEAKIEGVTYLEQKGGNIQLKPIKSFVERYYEDLPVVPIKKIKKGNRTQPPAQTTKPTPLPKPERKVITKPASLAPVAPAITKTQSDNKPPILKATPASISQENSAKPVVTPPPVKESKPIFKETISKPTIPEKTPNMSINERLALASKEVSSKSKTAATVTSNTASTASSSFSYTPPKDEGIGCVGPFISVLGLLLLLFLLWKGCNYVFENAPDGKEIVAAVDSTAQNLVNGTEELTGGIENKEVSSNDNSSDAPSECIIIAGVFSDVGNIRRMESRISNAGYKLYKAQYKGLTRVGFTFDCTDEDLPEYLLAVRRKLEPFAWYLEPDLYVEYE